MGAVGRLDNKSDLKREILGRNVQIKQNITLRSYSRCLDSARDYFYLFFSPLVKNFTNKYNINMGVS